ncbi:class I SAM-dependent methyltransferase [Argonema antarcticum]|uniref:class I SAM-dependent methyltransferase n=1 Tax=Argonema antarcticum TaxID=2942763 RepID=UPI00201262B9|nr:class I SAM-dependent methyltransferase [Argonema antarcticum]MCL1469344.1 class I SAM-dependent methyltransferase [Argonema antarcticum A004/B2]
MSDILGKIYDFRRPDSLASKLRKKRFVLLKSLLESIPGPLKILDVGGTQTFWEKMDFLSQEAGQVEITLFNINEIEVNHPQLKVVYGDARDMKQFADREFDTVVSNSAIEHVGDFRDQMQMANEIMRVGKRYFVQTPNLYFPIEPHFLFPFFQFLPLSVKVWLIQRFKLGWRGPVSDQVQAIEAVDSIKLLSKQKLLSLFPNANLFEEKFFGLTKSLTVYDGWE